MTLGYDNGALAVLTSAIRTETSQEAAIYGTDGYIKIPHTFWQPDRIIVKTSQDEEREFKFDRVGNGYNYEAAEVMRCLRNGCLESRILPLNTSVAIMRTMDNIRQQWGLVYPMEKGEYRPAKYTGTSVGQTLEKGKSNTPTHFDTPTE